MEFKTDTNMGTYYLTRI